MSHDQARQASARDSDRIRPSPLWSSPHCLDYMKASLATANPHTFYASIQNRNPPREANMSSPNTFPVNNKADDLLKRYMNILVYLFELSKSAENSKQPESLAIDNFSAGGIRHLLHSDSKAAFDWLRSECLRFTPEQEPALNQTIEAKKHMLAIVAEVAMAAAGELEAW